MIRIFETNPSLEICLIWELIWELICQVEQFDLNWFELAGDLHKYLSFSFKSLVQYSPKGSRDVIIDSDSELIPIQLSLFCEFWVELKTGEAYLNWVWIESGLCWIESELNLSTVKSKWIESELNPGLHGQESWAKQIKFTSSEIYPAIFFFSSSKLLMAVLHSLVFLAMIGQS